MIRKHLNTLFLLTWVSVMPFVGSAVISALIYAHPSLFKVEGTIELVLLFISFTLLLSLALSPTTFVCIVAGYFFDWLAVPLLVISYLVASTIGYFISRYVDNDTLMNYTNKKPRLQLLVNKLNNRALLFVIFTRLSPVLPFAIMNVVLAAMKINFKQYLLGSLIGMLPRTLLSIYLGIETNNLVKSIHGGEWSAFKVLALICLLIVSSLGIKILLQSKKSLKPTKGKAISR